MIVAVLDTQIFIYDTHLLRKEVGQQLLRFLQGKQGRLFIPEILRVEYLKQARKAANDKQKNVAANAGELLSLVGQGINYEVLTDETIDGATEDRLNALSAVTLQGPSMQELHGITGDRVVRERPPSPRAGYKDCMIWEAILTLEAGSEAYFVTRDNGFYDDVGFSQALLAEAEARNIRVRGFRKLDQLLQAIQKAELEVADARVADKIQNPPDAEPGEAVPAATPILPTELAPQAQGRQLEAALERVHGIFEQTDARVLGFIAYLEMASKDQVFDLLTQAGILPDIARNSAERLAHGGVIRDTGTHYLVEDRALALAAGSQVEEEIANLLNQGNADGQ